MYLIYKNDKGQVKFNGSRSDISITQIEGLGLPTPSFKTIEFANENGITQIGKKDSPKVITISGDVKDDDNLRNNINKILYEPGELYIYNDSENKYRKIPCKLTQPPGFVKQGAHYYRFAVQFQADYPYFMDFDATITPLFSQKNLVTDTFTLPCVFTTRLQNGIVNNTGDKYIYPTIVIKAWGTATSATGDITIKNTTTGAIIKINKVLEDNEIITIDLATRKIKSNVDDDITNDISDDTDLSKFYYVLGENAVEFDTTTEGLTLTCETIYYNEYLSAEV